MLEADFLILIKIFSIDGLDLLVQFLYKDYIGIGRQFGFLGKLMDFFIDFLLQSLMTCISKVEISVVDSNLRRNLLEM